MDEPTKYDKADTAGRSRLLFDRAGHVPGLIHETADITASALLETFSRSTDFNGDSDPAADTAGTVSATSGAVLRSAGSAFAPGDVGRCREERNSGASEVSVKQNGSDSRAYSSDADGRPRRRRAHKKAAHAYGTGTGTGRAAGTAERSAKTAEKTAEGSRKAAGFISRHRRGLLAAGGVLALILVSFSAVSSCSVLFDGMASVITVTTYPVKDEDIYAAEEMYCGMEEGLAEYVRTFENSREYDEYRYEVDDTGHDPYVLISAITALRGGAWTGDDIADTLILLYSHQYRVTVTVRTETRYRTDTFSDVYWMNDPSTGESRPVPYVYTVKTAYEWRICTLRLANIGLTSVPDDVMTEGQLSVYEMYMKTLGNRPDLFPDSEYVKNRRNGG